MLGELLDSGELPLAQRVKALVAPEEAQVPDLPVPDIDLETYDVLLEDQSQTVEVPA